MCPCPLGAGEPFLTALNTPRRGCCRSGWLQCHPHWELPYAHACAGLQHPLLGTQGCPQHQETLWLCHRTLQTGKHQLYS